MLARAKGRLWDKSQWRMKPKEESSLLLPGVLFEGVGAVWSELSQIATRTACHLHLQCPQGPALPCTQEDWVTTLSGLQSAGRDKRAKRRHSHFWNRNLDMATVTFSHSSSVNARSPASKVSHRKRGLAMWTNRMSRKKGKADFSEQLLCSGLYTKSNRSEKQNRSSSWPPGF